MPRFNPDLPTLEGEEIEEVPTIDREDISRQIANLQPLYDAITSPYWEQIDRYIALVEEDMTERLIRLTTGDGNLFRGRIDLARELRQLPANTAAKLAMLREQLEEEGSGADT